LLLAGITLLALGLRLYRLDAQSIWLDEAICWRETQASWSNFLDTFFENECNPPLFFALMKLWTGAAGDGPMAMRLPAALFGTLTIPLLGAFVWRLAGPGAGCYAALLLAVSPFHIDFSQEARPYTLLPLLVLAATAALAWALETGGKKRWALYAFCALLASYTHYFTVHFLAAHGCSSHCSASGKDVGGRS